MMARSTLRPRHSHQLYRAVEGPDTAQDDVAGWGVVMLGDPILEIRIVHPRLMRGEIVGANQVEYVKLLLQLDNKRKVAN